MTGSPFSAIRAAATDGRLENVRYRQDQLQKLHTKLSSAASDFIDALKSNGSQHGDAEQEVATALSCLVVHYESLDFEQSIKDEYRVSCGQDFANKRIPVGIVSIKPGRFTPFFSVVSPLCAAIAGGNCVIIQVLSLILIDIEIF
jgi:acyl-CoA reductase-like NAD-dependent aldehyde dehydrogenase